MGNHVSKQKTISKTSFLSLSPSYQDEGAGRFQKRM
jgi:hypothetical protein